MYSHDGANAKFITNSNETDNGVGESVGGWVSVYLFSLLFVRPID
jgi:hypothetical protein